MGYIIALQCSMFGLLLFRIIDEPMMRLFFNIKKNKYHKECQKILEEIKKDLVLSFGVTRVTQFLYSHNEYKFIYKLKIESNLFNDDTYLLLEPINNLYFFRSKNTSENFIVERLLIEFNIKDSEIRDVMNKVNEKLILIDSHKLMKYRINL